MFAVIYADNELSTLRCVSLAPVFIVYKLLVFSFVYLYIYR